MLAMPERGSGSMGKRSHIIQELEHAVGMTSTPDPSDTNLCTPVAVLCDFDNTITAGDSVVLLYESFGGPKCAELTRRWGRGEVSTMEEQQGCFAEMTASRAAMEALLDSVHIDSGFPAFLQFCRRLGYCFAVVSDGLDWIIHYVLRRHGLNGVTVHANEMRFTPQGVRLSFPHHDPDSPLRGISKPSIISRYKARGYQVVFVGDGLTDLEAAPAADLVYAKHELLWHCREQGIKAHGFSDFADLLEKWVPI